MIEDYILPKNQVYFFMLGNMFLRKKIFCHTLEDQFIFIINQHSKYVVPKRTNKQIISLIRNREKSFSLFTGAEMLFSESFLTIYLTKEVTKVLEGTKSINLLPLRDL